MKHFFLLLVCCFLCNACTEIVPNSEENNSAQKVATETTEITTPTTSESIKTVAIENRALINVNAFTMAIKAFKDEFGGAYDKVLWAAAVNEQLYFYVLKGKWEDSYWINDYEQDRFEIKKGGYTIGLVNQNNEVIIPVEYDKVYNIGGTSSNLIVAERAGKYATYDLEGNNLIEYGVDGIYPASMLEGACVQVKRGTNYGWLSEDGS